MRGVKPSIDTQNDDEEKRRQFVGVSINDADGGRLDIAYNFNPPLSIDSRETPALKLGRKVIKVIEENTE